MVNKVMRAIGYFFAGVALLLMCIAASMLPFVTEVHGGTYLLLVGFLLFILLLAALSYWKSQRDKKLMGALKRLWGEHTEHVYCFIRESELVMRYNTFVNPYTQDMPKILSDRVERLRNAMGTGVVEEQFSKSGFMSIKMTIAKKDVSLELMNRIKAATEAIANEEEPHQTVVCLQVEYNGGIAYFEDSWWYPLRAIIKTERGYERYDFSDELTFDQEMWDLVEGEFDHLEDSETMELIPPSEFQERWEHTPLVHVPTPL